MIFLDKSETIGEETAVTVGMFDGVHLGHKALMDSLRKYADGRKTLVFTFLAADGESLFTNAEKQQLLEQTGLNFAYMQNCTPDFYATPKEGFIELLIKQYNMRVLVVGQDFRFGRNAEGDSEYLQQNADRFGISVQVVPPVLWEGEKISSSRIRRLVSQGNVAEAAKMLGGYYFATGSVEEGNRIGSSMNFPTANINTFKIMPANGVYATFTEVDGKRLCSVTNVGVRPTVAPDGPVNMETNIFDFKSKIYGQAVTIYFVERLRDEIRFSGLDALRAQIAKDKQKAQDILNALQK